MMVAVVEGSCLTVIGALNPVPKTFFKCINIIVPVVDGGKDKSGKQAKKEEFDVSGSNVEFHRVDFKNTIVRMKLLRKWIVFLPRFLSFFNCIDAPFLGVGGSKDKGSKCPKKKEFSIPGGILDFHSIDFNYVS